MLGNILGVDEYLSKNVCWNHELELNVLSIITPISFNQNMCTNTNVWGVNVRMHKKNVHKHGALVCTPILIKKITRHTTGAWGCKFEQFWTILKYLNYMESFSCPSLSILYYLFFCFGYLGLSRTISANLRLPSYIWLSRYILSYLRL